MRAQTESYGGQDAQGVSSQNHVLSTESLQVLSNDRRAQKVCHLEHATKGKWQVSLRKHYAHLRFLHPGVMLFSEDWEEGSQIHVERL